MQEVKIMILIENIIGACVDKVINTKLENLVTEVYENEYGDVSIQMQLEI